MTTTVIYNKLLTAAGGNANVALMDAAGTIATLTAERDRLNVQLASARSALTAVLTITIVMQTSPVEREAVIEFAGDLSTVARGALTSMAGSEQAKKDGDGAEVNTTT